MLFLLFMLPWVKGKAIDLLDQSMEPHQPNYCNDTSLLASAGLIQSTLGQFLGYECSEEFFHCRGSSDGFRTYRKTCRVGLVYDTLGTQNCNYDYNVRGCKMSKGAGACNATQFACALSETCVAMNQRCDGHYDCAMEEDEQNCPMCAAGEFACVVSEECIPMERRCNGLKECTDGSDEDYCDVCGAGRFLCGKSGECINAEERCDGERNCPHGEDELLCRQGLKPVERRFTCESRDAYIAMNQVCDGVPNCPDGSDEAYCEKLGIVPTAGGAGPMNPVPFPITLNSRVSTPAGVTEEEEEEEEDDDSTEDTSSETKSGPLFPVLSIQFPTTTTRRPPSSPSRTPMAVRTTTRRPTTPPPSHTLADTKGWSPAFPLRTSHIAPSRASTHTMRTTMTTKEFTRLTMGTRPETTTSVEMPVTATAAPLIVFEKTVALPTRPIMRPRVIEGSSARPAEHQKMTLSSWIDEPITHLSTLGERILTSTKLVVPPILTTHHTRPVTTTTRRVTTTTHRPTTTATTATTTMRTTTRMTSGRRTHYPTVADSSEERGATTAKTSGNTPRSQVVRSLRDERSKLDRAHGLESKRVSGPRIDKIHMRFNDETHTPFTPFFTTTTMATTTAERMTTEKTTKSIVNKDLLKKIGDKLNLQSGKSISSRSLLTKIEEVLREELPKREEAGRSLRSLAKNGTTRAETREEREEEERRMAHLSIFDLPTTSRSNFSFKIMSDTPRREQRSLLGGIPPSD